MTASMTRSDGRNGDVRVAGSEELEVVGVVGCDNTATETDGGGDDQGVDGHLASGARSGQEMTSDASDPGSGGYDLGKAARQDRVNGLVGTTSAVELHEHR